MQFNLKSYLTKSAARDLNTTTEGQLKNKGKAPSSLQEGQLDKSRAGEPKAIAEKQLDAARAKKDAPSSTTEAQLGNNSESANSTTEKQLAGNQVGGSTDPVEKRLQKVREATFNLKTFMAKHAKKNDPSNQVTEGQLGERGKNEPKDLTDAQLDKGRKDTKPVTTQALLEKARTGEADRLVEARLDSSDSKLVKHRNPGTSAGNIPKLEEQRIKASKTAEGEKYKPASETDKDLMLPKVDGKDGIKTASASFWRTKLAEDISYDTSPAAISDGAPQSDVGQEDSEDPLVYEESTQDIDVGETKMRQIVVRFEPSQIISEQDAMNAVTSLVVSTHPSVGKQSADFNLSKSVTLMMDEGKAVVTLPVEAFSATTVGAPEDIVESFVDGIAGSSQDVAVNPLSPEKAAKLDEALRARFSDHTGQMKTAQAPSTAQQIETAFKGLAGGIAEASKAKVQEYVQRIMKGEQKERVLEGQGPTMIKNVEAVLAQLQGQKGQQATPAASQQPQQQSGQQYSLSKSEQWANSTKDPNIMDYVGKVNQKIQTQGTQKWQAVLNIIMKAMGGDQSALQQLKQKTGGQAVPAQ